jgi:hypothetical protein
VQSRTGCSARSNAAEAAAIRSIASAKLSRAGDNSGSEVDVIFKTDGGLPKKTLHK